MNLPLASRRVTATLVSLSIWLFAIPGARAGDTGNTGPGANAGRIGQTGQSGPHGKDHLGNNICKDCAGDPVDLSTGEINFERTDLVLPGLLEPLVISFQYRNQRTYNGHWGFGWFFPYEMRLFQLTGGNVMWRIGTGEQKLFVRSGLVYTPPADHHVTLIQTGGGGFELKEKGGVRYLFSPEGLLTEIVDRAGNSIHFEYATDGSGAKQRLPIAGPTGAVLALDYRLTGMTDTLGKTVTFTYYGASDGPKNGRLENITDSYGRVVDYDYDANGNLASVTSPSTEFQDVGGGLVTRGRVTTYTYSSGFQSTVIGAPVELRDHNLLTVVDDRGLTQLVNVHDANDRIMRQEFNGRTTTFAYTVHPNGNVTQCNETDANGFLHKHKYDPNGNGNGNLMELAFVGAGIHPGVGGDVATKYTYSPAQEVTQVDFPVGNVVKYVRDGQGNVTKEIRKTAANVSDTDSNNLIRDFTYEPQLNRVRTAIDELGKTTTFDYDYEEATLGDVNGDGLTNQTAGNVVRIIHPDATRPDGSVQTAIVTKYQYNAYGQLVRTIDPEGHEVERQYFASGNPLFGRLRKVIVDPSGLALTTEYDYDTSGFLKSVKDARGNTTNFTANKLGELREVSAPLGVQFKGTYDANGNLVKSEIHNVDEAGAPLTPEWIVSTRVYDAWNRMTSMTEDVTASTTRTTAYEYDGLSNLTRVTSPAGRVVKIDYDERSIPWRTTRGFGATEAAIRIVHVDKNGNTTQTIDGEAHATNYFYDLFDRMTSATDALQSPNKLEIDWTKRSQVAERRLRNPGNVLATKVQFTYDELGRRTKRTEVDAITPSSISESWFELDKASRLVKTRSPRGFFTQIGYDAANRRTSMTDAIGNSLAWLLDPNGNPLTVTSTEKVPSSPDEVYVVESEFDALDRVQETRRIDRLNASHQLLTSFDYDSRSNLVSVIDPIGRITSRVFDLAGRMSSVTEDQASLSITTQLGFDKDDLQTSLTDASSNVTSFLFDALGRRTRTTYPGGTFEQFGYDHSSNLTSHRTADGVLTNLAYFANNRLQSRTCGALSEAFVWNCFGAPLSAQVSNGSVVESSVTFTYDGFGRVDEEEQGDPSGFNFAVEHGYDAGHNLTSLIYPGGFNPTQGFDALDRLNAVTAGTLNASYTYAGPSRVKTRTTGAVQTNTWDGLKRLSGIGVVTPPPTNITLLSLLYGHDDLDRRTYVERFHQSLNGVGDVYAYDGGSRLKDAWYDAIDPSQGSGNALSHLTVNQTKVEDRTSTVLDSVTTTYNTPDALHRYTQIGSTVRVYDEKGNLLDDGSQLFEYDAWNRLVRVSDKASGAERARYQIDALGRRWRKIEPDRTTTHIYSGARLLGDYEPSGSFQVMKRRYLYGAGLDEVIAIDVLQQGPIGGGGGGQSAMAMAGGGSQQSTYKRYFVYQDALGSTELITTNLNAVFERYEYDAFGQAVVKNSSGNPIIGAYGRAVSAIKNPFWFAAARWDIESGQYHVRARQYEPLAGRFVSRDPLGYVDGPNLYGYAHSDPVNWNDPFGLEAGNGVLGWLLDPLEAGWNATKDYSVQVAIPYAADQAVKTALLVEGLGYAAMALPRAAIETGIGTYDSARFLYDGSYTQRYSVFTTNEQTQRALNSGSGEMLLQNVVGGVQQSWNDFRYGSEREIAHSVAAGVWGIISGKVAKSEMTPKSQPVAPSRITPGRLCLIGDDMAKALDEIAEGRPRPNVRKPQPFNNDGRGGTAMLPATDRAENPISYVEHTVNPRPPRGVLDGKRIVTGSDGSVWLTIDHFETWIQIQ
jgi:RHS repeat-associated protein